jgi:hypothetical protein
MRPLFFLATLISAATLFAGGCRSCSDCHDYDPPVANCECNAYGTHRAGSACGCGGCGCGSHVEESYYDEGEGVYAPSHEPMMQEEAVER